MDNKHGFSEAYMSGAFVAKLCMSGHIISDIHRKNLGYDTNHLVMVDYPNAKIISIPDDISSETIRQLSLSFLSLYNDYKEDKNKIYVRSGFVAKGGILADTIINYCRNKFSFSSLSLYSDTSDLPISKCNKAPNLTTLERECIKEWSLLQPDIEAFLKQSDHNFNSVSLYNRYYIDRFCDSISYMYSESDMYPEIYAKSGISALYNNHYYRAYGLLKKAMILLQSNNNFNCANECQSILNELISRKKINSNYLQIIDNLPDMDYFELTCFLDDIDAIVSQQ